MKARRLIEQQDFLGPEQLVIVAGSFEEAWRLVEGSFLGDANREAGRLRLANVVMELARQGVVGREKLIEMAVEAMHRPLH